MAISTLKRFGFWGGRWTLVMILLQWTSGIPWVNECRLSAAVSRSIFSWTQDPALFATLWRFGTRSIFTSNRMCQQQSLLANLAMFFFGIENSWFSSPGYRKSIPAFLAIVEFQIMGFPMAKFGKTPSLHACYWLRIFSKSSPFSGSFKIHSKWCNLQIHPSPDPSHCARRAPCCQASAASTDMRSVGNSGSWMDQN